MFKTADKIRDRHHVTPFLPSAQNWAKNSPDLTAVIFSSSAIWSLRLHNKSKQISRPLVVSCSISKNRSNLIWCPCADLLGSFGYTKHHITCHCSGTVYEFISGASTNKIVFFWFFQFVHWFWFGGEKKQLLIYSGWACLVRNGLSNKDLGELWVCLCRSSWPALISSFLFAFSLSHQTDTIQLGCLH